MRIATLSHRRRWRGFFRRYPERWRGPPRSPALPFTLDNWPISIRQSADARLTPQQALEQLTWEGVKARYPEGLPDEVKEKLDHEKAFFRAYPKDWITRRIS